MYAKPTFTQSKNTEMSDQPVAVFQYSDSLFNCNTNNASINTIIC